MSTTEPGKKKGGCRGCLVTIAIFAAVPLLLFVGYGLWGVYANARAERQSAAFCGAVKVGDTRTRVLALAKGENAPGNTFDTDNGYRFMYYGMIYNAREFRVVLAADRVVSSQLIVFDD